MNTDTAIALEWATARIRESGSKCTVFVESYVGQSHVPTQEINLTAQDIDRLYAAMREAREEQS